MRTWSVSIEGCVRTQEAHKVAVSHENGSHLLRFYDEKEAVIAMYVNFAYFKEVITHAEGADL